jgi:hypothetical protein
VVTACHVGVLDAEVVYNENEGDPVGGMSEEAWNDVGLGVLMLSYKWATRSC